MFNVLFIVRSDCDAKESHTDRDVYQVEDRVTGQSLKLCPKCLLDMVKLRSKGRKEEPKEAAPNGWGSVATPTS